MWSYHGAFWLKIPGIYYQFRTIISFLSTPRTLQIFLQKLQIASHNWVFPVCFHWIQWQNIFIIKRIVDLGFSRGVPNPERDSECANLLFSKYFAKNCMKMKELGSRERACLPNDASVIYQIPWIHWIYWIFIPFRGNYNTAAEAVHRFRTCIFRSFVATLCSNLRDNRHSWRGSFVLRRHHTNRHIEP